MGLGEFRTEVEKLLFLKVVINILNIYFKKIINKFEKNLWPNYMA